MYPFGNWYWFLRTKNSLQGKTLFLDFFGTFRLSILSDSSRIPFVSLTFEARFCVEIKNETSCKLLYNQQILFYKISIIAPFVIIM